MARLPGRKAPGPDGIPNEVLKCLPTTFHEALHRVFTLMWKGGTTPNRWKDDVVIRRLVYSQYSMCDECVTPAR
eukprot:1195524-Prorocentrum_minimum.AAC.2